MLAVLFALVLWLQSVVDRYSPRCAASYDSGCKVTDTFACHVSGSEVGFCCTASRSPSQKEGVFFFFCDEDCLCEPHDGVGCPSLVCASGYVFIACSRLCAALFFCQSFVNFLVDVVLSTGG